jgi:hypothetical protein
MFRLDRTAFKVQSFQEADQNRAYWLSKLPMERLAAAWYLSCCTFNVDPQKIKMDRTVFQIRKRSSI